MGRTPGSIDSELSFKRDLLKAMKRMRFDAQPHEDKWDTGIPDISWAKDGMDGWLEVKWEDKGPNVTGQVVLHTLTSKQALWLRRRGEAGNNRVFLMLGTPEVTCLWPFTFVLPWEHATRRVHIPWEECKNKGQYSLGEPADWPVLLSRLIL